MDPPRDVFGLPILGAHATVPPAQPQQVPFNPFGFAPMFVGAPQPAAPPNPLPVLPPQPMVLPPPAPVPQPVAASSSLQYDAVRIRQPSQQFALHSALFGQLFGLYYALTMFSMTVLCVIGGLASLALTTHGGAPEIWLAGPLPREIPG